MIHVILGVIGLIFSLVSVYYSWQADRWLRKAERIRQNRACEAAKQKQS